MQTGKGPWRLLDWDHEIIGKKVPSSPRKYAKFGCSLKTSCFGRFGLRKMTLLLISTNDMSRRSNKLHGKGLLEYAGIAWEKALKEGGGNLYLWKIL